MANYVQVYVNDVPSEEAAIYRIFNATVESVIHGRSVHPSSRDYQRALMVFNRDDEASSEDVHEWALKYRFRNLIRESFTRRVEAHLYGVIY